VPDLLPIVLYRCALQPLGRGLWLAHTVGTRAAYDRARQELLNRRALDERPDTQVTAAPVLIVVFPRSLALTIA